MLRPTRNETCSLIHVQSFFRENENRGNDVTETLPDSNFLIFEKKEKKEEEKSREK